MNKGPTATFLMNGITLSGPVTTQDNIEYLFRNINNAHDVYFLLKKGSDGQWFQSGGPTIQFPRQMIQTVGEQIDQHLKKEN